MEKTPLSLENFTPIEDLTPFKIQSPTYKFHQRFGERKTSDVYDQDEISSLSFDKNGLHLAVGDKAGRIVIFKYSQKMDELNEETTTEQFCSFSNSCSISQKSPKSDTEKKNSYRSFEYDFDFCKDFEYDYVHEFQSHKEEVDVLKNKVISPEISNIEWLTSNGTENFLITTNHRAIKMWKIKENVRKDSFVYNESPYYSTKLDKDFFKFHEYNINSISVAQNEENFLSADDLQIYLWDVNKPNNPYNLIDLTPFDIEDLSEVITSCSYHPSHDNLFLFSSSKGIIRIADMRKNSVCDKSCLTLKENKNIYKDCDEFSAIIRSLSSCKFMQDSTKIISRDFLNIFIWDIRNEKAPIKTIPIFQPLKKKLRYLLKNEQIFDQFSLSINNWQKTILTGNYDDSFHIIDIDGSKNTQYQILEDDDICVKTIENDDKDTLKSWNFENKFIKSQFHPTKNCLALASHNCLYIMKK